jgi:hypothetical protein
LLTFRAAIFAQKHTLVQLPDRMKENQGAKVMDRTNFWMDNYKFMDDEKGSIVV